MNELRKFTLQKEGIKDPKRYFYRLLDAGCEYDFLSSQDRENIQMELYILMTKQVNRYTSFESSSIREEKAQQIFSSICYVLGGYFMTVEDFTEQMSLLKQMQIEELFQRGLKVETAYITDANEMLKLLESGALKVNNLAYHDTIHGMSEFFRYYDLKYAAAEDAGYIDYPLAIEIRDVTGIHYLKEYLKRISMENEFLSRFSDQRIEWLLRGYSNDYKELLVNIFELVLMNSLGLTILKKDIYGLDIGEEERGELSFLLGRVPKEEFQEFFADKAEELYKELKLENSEVLSYMKQTIFQALPRVQLQIQEGKLNKTFLSLKKESKTAVLPVFKDGAAMEDDNLRDLIEEMQDLRFIKDKITVIKNHIHSLKDLIEILDVCIFDEEYKEVYKLLSPAEISVLYQNIKEEEMEALYPEAEKKQWQTALLHYIDENGLKPGINLTVSSDCT